MTFTPGLLLKDNMGKASAVLPPFSLHSCLTLQQQTWHPQDSPEASLLIAASLITSHGHPCGHHTFCLKPFAPQDLQELHSTEKKLPEVPSFSTSHQIQTPPEALKRPKLQNKLNYFSNFDCIIPKSFPLLSALYTISCQAVH